MKKTLIAVAALVMTAAGHAEPYAVISGGVTKHLDACDDLEAGVQCDDQGGGLKILGGYKLTPNLAIEGGYLNFGKSSLTAGVDTFNFKADGSASAAHFTMTSRRTGTSSAASASRR